MRWVTSAGEADQLIQPDIAGEVLVIMESPLTLSNTTGVVNLSAARVENTDLSDGSLVETSRIIKSNLVCRMTSTNCSPDANSLTVKSNWVFNARRKLGSSAGPISNIWGIWVEAFIHLIIPCLRIGYSKSDSH